jgi:hypothetical protein
MVTHIDNIDQTPDKHPNYEKGDSSWNYYLSEAMRREEEKRKVKKTRKVEPINRTELLSLLSRERR